MSKPHKSAFYAVHKGLQPGIYFSWADCERQIKGYPNARFKKFSTKTEADEFVRSGTATSITHAVASEVGGPSNTQTFQSEKETGKVGANEITGESEWEVVYTNGAACQGNDKKGAIAGIGIWWGDNDPRNLAERCPGDQTNDRAELIAIIRVLERTPYSNKPLLIRTDSSYSISCVQDWIPRKRNWKTSEGKDVKNKALIVYLSYLLDERSRRGQIARLQHVPGHAGNEAANRLAGAGTLMPKKDSESEQCREWTQNLDDDFI